MQKYIVMNENPVTISWQNIPFYRIYNLHKTLSVKYFIFV